MNTYREHGTVMKLGYVIGLFGMLTGLVSCTPERLPVDTKRMTNACSSSNKMAQAHTQQPKTQHPTAEPQTMIKKAVIAVDQYDDVLQAMQAVQHLMAVLRQGASNTIVDSSSVRLIAKHEQAAEALLTELHKVAVTETTYAVLTAIYALIEQESVHKGVQCETMSQWGETAWKMYDGEVAKAKLMQAIDTADVAAEGESAPHVEQIRSWANYIVGQLVEIHAAYLDEAEIIKLGPRVHDSAPDDVRFAWYQALWETYAQQGKLEEAQQIGVTAAQTLPHHPGAQRMNEMLAAFHNVRPATQRLALARIAYLHRQKMGKETIADKLTRATSAP